MIMRQVWDPATRRFVTPIRGGSAVMLPALVTVLLPLLPKVVDSVISMYEAIANHPDTPEQIATQVRQLVADIQALNLQIQAAPLPGDESAI